MNTQHKEVRRELLKKTDEELHELHMQALASEEIDVDNIACITEILAERHPEEFHFDKEGILDAVLQNMEEDAPENSTKPNASVTTRKRRTLRNLIGIAAVLAVVVTAMAAIPVHGSSLLSRFAHWTSELFSFGSEEIEKTGEESVPLHKRSPDSMALHDLLVENGVTEQLAPTFIPEDFAVQTLISEVEDAGHQKYYAEFSDESGNVITISIRNYGSIEPVVEKDDSEVTIYTEAGIDHYVLANLERNTVSWSNGDFRCTIDYPVDYFDETTLYAIIDSIYT